MALFGLLKVMKMSDILLPCLSIQQPWPWAMFYADKDFENRTWNTKFRGIFLIHAGSTIDKDGLQSAIDEGYLTGEEELKTGGIVGIAEITDCVEESVSDWFFGPYGFKIENAKELPFYPCKGKLSFYKQTYPRNKEIEEYLLAGGW